VILRFAFISKYRSSVLIIFIKMQEITDCYW